MPLISAPFTFQEIFIKIHQRADQYDEARPLHPWLFTVVANTVRSYFSKKKLRSFFVWEPAPEDVKDPAPDSEARASAKETAAWLERAIEALPMPQREVLVLATIENLRKAKDVYKTMRILGESSTDRRVAARLYAATIGAGLIHHGKRISRQSDAALTRGLKSLQDDMEMPESLRRLAEAGLILLDGST